MPAKFPAMAPLVGKVWVYDLAARSDPGRCNLADEFVRFYSDPSGASMWAGSSSARRAVPAKIVDARHEGDRIILTVAESRRRGDAQPTLAQVEIRFAHDGTIVMRRGQLGQPPQGKHQAATPERRLAPCPLQKRDVPQT